MQLGRLALGTMNKRNTGTMLLVYNYCALEEICEKSEVIMMGQIKVKLEEPETAITELQRCDRY